jgi:hypothetical protein
MAYAFDRRRNTGLGDYTGYHAIDPAPELSPSGIFGDVQGVRPTAATSEQQSQQPSLGEAIGGLIVLIVALWLAGMFLTALFGSGADLTPVERQILASA